MPWNSWARAAGWMVMRVGVGAGAGGAGAAALTRPGLITAIKTSIGRTAGMPDARESVGGPGRCLSACECNIRVSRTTGGHAARPISVILCAPALAIRNGITAAVVEDDPIATDDRGNGSLCAGGELPDDRQP